MINFILVIVFVVGFILGVLTANATVYEHVLYMARKTLSNNEYSWFKRMLKVVCNKPSD